MNKNKLKSIFERNIKLLEKYNKSYYQDSNPLITDQKYDDLKKKILDLEIKHPYLKSKKSPSITIGYKPSKSFKKAFYTFFYCSYILTIT